MMQLHVGVVNIPEAETFGPEAENPELLGSCSGSWLPSGADGGTTKEKYAVRLANG